MFDGQNPVFDGEHAATNSSVSEDEELVAACSFVDAYFQEGRDLVLDNDDSISASNSASSESGSHSAVSITGYSESYESQSKTISFIEDSSVSSDHEEYHPLPPLVPYVGMNTDTIQGSDGNHNAENSCDS